MPYALLTTAENPDKRLKLQKGQNGPDGNTCKPEAALLRGYRLRTELDCALTSVGLGIKKHSGGPNETDARAVVHLVGYIIPQLWGRASRDGSTGLRNHRDGKR